jgi:hypothetical protein
MTAWHPRAHPERIIGAQPGRTRPFVSIAHLLLAVSLVSLLSVFGSKVSGRVGVPALLLFLVLGMLAESDGPGGIEFYDPRLASVNAPLIQLDAPIERVTGVDVLMRVVGKMM